MTVSYKKIRWLTGLGTIEEGGGGGSVAERSLDLV